jgi:hypothetical protein
MRWLIVALLYSVCACGGPPPPPPGPPVPFVRVKKKPPPEPPPPPKSPFYVIGWSEHVSDKTDNPTKICAIEGNIFICGTGHMVRLAGDDLVQDPGLEIGLSKNPDGTLQGRIDEMLGRYPDDTWAVMRTGVNIGTSALYRRTAEWALAKKWKITNVTGSVDLIHWKPQTIAALTTNDGERYSVEVVTKTGALPMMALPGAAKCSQWLRWPKLGVDIKQSLVLTGSRCDGETPAFIKLDLGKLPEKRDGMPDLAVSASKSEYSIVSSSLERKTEGGSDEVPMPPPPIEGASTLVPFQVVTHDKDTLVAARFKKEKVQGVAILRLSPARKVLKF